VCEVEIVTKDYSLGFVQPSSESPHAIVIGSVTELTAPDDFVFEIDEKCS